jgi:hypothetical protein
MVLPNILLKNAQILTIKMGILVINLQVLVNHFVGWWWFGCTGLDVL